ncbi:hypothetical protein [Micromonospora maritima]|uniref:hypothetical protein n=1 Tax=Micromonospora maritima TaxID=986711 RepID=UPI00157DB0A8|nr:hypothetical protein [Micromonospora maritima]
MAYLLHQLIGEANEGVWVHYASGHFTRERAMAGLQANGLSEVDAATLLDQPVPAEKFDEWKTWPRPAAEQKEAA